MVFMPPGSVGTFSAAYLACRLFGLNAELMRHAVGIAGSMTFGKLERWSYNTHAKALHPGWAAHSGMIAAYLARAGLTGPRNVLEGRWGFFRSHVQQPDHHYQFHRLTADLGKEWESRNLSFKPFPVGHVSHPYISAILRLHAQGLRADQVNRITCLLNKEWIPIVAEPLHESSNRRRPGMAASASSTRWPKRFIPVEMTCIATAWITCATRRFSNWQARCAARWIQMRRTRAVQRLDHRRDQGWTAPRRN